MHELQHELFRMKKGEIQSGQLLPCEDCVFQHTKKPNYQTTIWKNCFLSFPEFPSPKKPWLVNCRQKYSH